MRYVAFLRGINSGKSPTVKMATLRKVLEDLGYQDVQTILASGNLLFIESASTKMALENTIQKALAKSLGIKSEVFVRSADDLRELQKLEPFRNVKITPQTRTYVTFLRQPLEDKLKFPIAGKGYIILREAAGAVFSQVDLTAGMTPDLMQALDKTFGKSNTTRNWNTIEKILEAAR